MTPQEEFSNFLFKKKEDMRSVRNFSNEKLVELRLLNINQRRDFFLHITTLALGIAAGVNFFTEKVVSEFYFGIGFFSLMGCVFFILFWFREMLDKEARDLQGRQDKYSELAEENLALIDSYLANMDSFSISMISDFQKKSLNLPSTLALKEDVEVEKKKRKNRGNEPLEYSGEILVFLFSVGVFFLTLSVSNYNPNNRLIFLILVMVAALSFNDFLLSWVSKFSKFIEWLRNPYGPHH